MTVITHGDGNRDLAALVVPLRGSLVATGEPFEPFRLADPDGEVVGAVSVFMRDLMARGCPASTQRSYGMDLLRWYRFLWAAGVPWEQATRAEARDFCCWLMVADKPRRGHWRRPDAEPPAAARAAAPNPVTGKLPPGPRLAPATVAHCESVVRGFYDFHLEAGTGPIVNPFPLARRLALGWHQERGLASLRPRSFDLVAGAGLLPLVCADVIRPGAGWLLGAGGMRGLAAEMERARDRDGFAALRRAGAAAPGRQNLALRQVAAVMAAKGGTVADITVGDCLELLAAAGRAGAGPGATSVYFYQLLHAAGMLPGSAPATVRAFRTRGQLSPAQMTGLYGIECQPVRELLADYLTERQPALDYASLRSLAHMLCRLFWRDLEIHHPGIRSLRLDAAAASAWRERLLAKTVTRRTPGGQLTTTSAPRADPLNPLTAVRAFYLDIAEWAIEDPARWGPWAAPSPVRSRDLAGRKQHSRRKARMDQRTRERLPVLPQLVAAAAAASAAARGLLDAAGRAGPGQEFTAAGRTLRRAVLTRGTSARTLADDPAAGRRRDLTLEEHRAFWSWAAIEVLRHTGIRVEELTELSHHSLIQYRLPGTGELIPLLQIAPSKTDTERLLVISPELADVLSAVVCRIRGADGAVPLAVAYDPHERTWLPPMPLLFQRRMRAEHRPIPAQAIRDLLAGAVAGLGIAGPDGAPLRYSPHDFRRMFITDAKMGRIASDATSPGRRDREAVGA